MAINIPIISEFQDGGVQKAIREFQKLETAGEKAQFAIKKAAVPAGLALGGLAVAAGSAFKAFAEDQVGAEQLAQTLKNVTLDATDQTVASMEEFITKTSMAAAVADDELRPAMENLLRGTGEVTEAQRLMNLALDISAGTGKDLNTVTMALSKAYTGNVAGLKKLDPALGALIKNGATTDQVFTALGNTFSGQAATKANSASGQMERLSITFGELQESIGAAVAPLLEKLLPAFQSFAEWIMNNTDLVIGIGIAIGGIALAIWGANAAIAAWNAITKITAALNAVLGTSFSTLWVATGVGIILAIIAAVVLLNQKFHFLDDVINVLKKAFEVWWSVVSAVLGWIWDKITAVAGVFSSVFGTAIDLVKGYFDTWWNVVSAIGEKVIGVFTGIGDGIKDAFKAAFNFVADAWNNTVGKLSFKVPSWVPGLGGKGFDVPDIPKLADGGIVTGPTIALIGEAGPEAVVPLNRRNGFGASSITINVAGSVIEERRLIESIRRGLVDAQRSGYQLVYSNTDF